MLAFRDHLRVDEADRTLYERTKREARGARGGGRRSPISANAVIGGADRR